MLFKTGVIMQNRKREELRSTVVTCPKCDQEVKVIPFGDRFVAVCCNTIIYVGHHYPFKGSVENRNSPTDTRDQPAR